MKSAPHDERSLAATLRAVGGRVTGPRLAVLGALRRSARALTHREIEQAVAAAAVDRVTVYRVLEWLVEEGLVHRVPGDDRVGRFSAAGSAAGGHSHFTCVRCACVFCVGVAPAPRPRLPRGFRVESAELTLRGLCADCARGER